MKIFLILFLSIILFAEDNCVKSSHGNKVCFEFELDKKVMQKNQNTIDNIADFCFATNYDRLVLEDTASIDNGKGYRYTIKVLTGNSNDKFEFNSFKFKQSKLFNCTNSIKSSSSKNSYCHAIRDHDMKNSCIAITENNQGHCHTIQNQDMKNSCIAITGNNQGHCYTIQNQDMKNSCIAITENNQGYCHTIQNQDMKNKCIAITGNNQGNCHTIQNQDMKNECIANFK